MFNSKLIVKSRDEDLQIWCLMNKKQVGKVLRGTNNNQSQSVGIKYNFQLYIAYFKDHYHLLNISQLELNCKMAVKQMEIKIIWGTIAI